MADLAEVTSRTGVAVALRPGHTGFRQVRVTEFQKDTIVTRIRRLPRPSAAIVIPLAARLLAMSGTAVAATRGGNPNCNPSEGVAWRRRCS